MLYDFSSAISFFATHSITVTRPGATTVNTDFHTAAGTPSSFLIVADAHPVTKKLNQSAEGDFASYDLQLQTSTLLLKGDMMVVDGKTYMVAKVSDRMTQGGFCIAYLRGVTQ